MERLKLIVAVAGHGLGERMGAALESAGCAVCFHLSGQGTAKAAWLEMLGLSETRRARPGPAAAPSFTGAAQACMRRRSSLALPSSPKRSWC